MPGDATRALASMGNYVFDTQTLIDIVSPTGTDDIATDIGGDVIPMLTRAGVAHMYDFSTNLIPGQAEHERGYWRDVGSLDAYYEANMDLIAPVPPFSLYNREWPVYSLQLPLPPAKIDHGPGGERPAIDHSLLCAGSIVSGGTVERSILGPETYVDASAIVSESILFPGVRVGPGARLYRCVIDKNVEIPAGREIGDAADPAALAARQLRALPRRRQARQARSGARWSRGRAAVKAASPRTARAHRYRRARCRDRASRVHPFRGQAALCQRGSNDT